MENRIFVSEEPYRLRIAYTEEQIGGAPVISTEELKNSAGAYSGVKYLFTTWGAPVLSEEEIGELLPSLEAVFYAAGTVKYFALPYLKRGVHVFSAWAANGVPVAEFAAAQILLANKGYFQSVIRYKRDGFDEVVPYGYNFPGNFDTKVGVIGLGKIGRMVLERLRTSRLEILAWDKFLSEEEIAAMGARKASLEEIFSECQTISNHLANVPQTVGMLDYPLFARMKSFATFINTGRSAQLDMEGLKRAMREEPGRTALLDVTDPTEPLERDDELFTFPNILISPHIAGSIQSEIRRMGEYMTAEYRSFAAGEKCLYEVTESMLDTMA